MIICCGEALIDFIPTPDGGAYQPCPGGSILNIAVGLGRMAVPVGFLSRLSTDLFGDILAEQLLTNNVDLQFCPRVEGQTTLAFVSLADDENAEPQYAFYAEGAVDREMTVADLPAQLPDDVLALHFGSISLVLEPGGSTLESLMERESRKRVITLDPNVRPIVISDWEAYRQQFLTWVSYADILRLSQVDLDWLYSGQGIEDLLPGWFESGLTLVILTQGDSGATAFSADGSHVHVPAPKITVEDTVGAGDTFFSAVLTYLFEHDLLSDRQKIRKMTQADLHDCLDFGVRAAAINCTRKGANPPYRHEMEE